MLDSFIAPDAAAPATLAAVGIGVLLLFLGRRLYWFALGGAGFFVGLILARALLELSNAWLELGLAVVAGLLGALLAVLAQKLAVTLAGLVAGGWLAWLFVPPEWGTAGWIAVAATAVVGALLSGSLFELGLIAVSSLAGAALTVQPVVPGALQLWLFVALVVVGVVIQLRQRDSG